VCRGFQLEGAAADGMLEEMGAQGIAKDLVAEWDRQEELFDASVETLIARPVRSVHDLVELVELVRTEQRWLPGEKRYDNEVKCRELDALFAAIDVLAKGGVNV
jgi:hypothetical protein